MEALAEADLVLVVLDASQPIVPEDDELFKQAANRPTIVVENKIDLLGDGHDLNSGAVRTSATTGAGVAELRQEILKHIGSGAASETGFLTNVRHERLIRQAIEAVAASKTAVNNRIPHEMLLLDLYNCLRPLDEITGATTTDDILNLIFSTFCIGK